MGMKRREWTFVFVAAAAAVVGGAGALFLSIETPSQEAGEQAKAAASAVSEKLAPVVTWKLKMLRFFGL